MLEVGANTRVRDACDSIAARLQLASWEGCSLFIKIADKVCGPQARGREGRRLRRVGVSHQHWASPAEVHRHTGEGVTEPQGDTWPPAHLPACTLLSTWPRSSARRRETSSLTPCGMCPTG